VSGRPSGMGVWWSTCSCDSPHILIPTPGCRIGPSKKIVMDGYLLTHTLRSVFLGVRGEGSIFRCTPKCARFCARPPSAPSQPLQRGENFAVPYSIDGSQEIGSFVGSPGSRGCCSSGIRKPQVVRSIWIAGSTPPSAIPTSSSSSSLHSALLLSGRDEGLARSPREQPDRLRTEAPASLMFQACDHEPQAPRDQ